MEIHIRVIDGEVFRFRQDDEQHASKIIRAIHPSKIFSEPQIVIQGATGTSGFRGDAVESARFITKHTPSWTLPQVVEAFSMIDRRAFYESVTLLERQGQQARKPVVAGSPARGFAEFVMRSGSRLHCEYAVVASDRIDQIVRIQHFLEQPCYCANAPDGFTLINSANIIRWVLKPGPAETPAPVWRANRIT